VSRAIEQQVEDRATRERSRVVVSVYGGLEAAVGRAGGELVGLSVAWRGTDVLMTLRARFPAGRMVGFVGAADLPAVFVKAAREASADQVRWREDNYRVNGGWPDSK
jgi:hypothetical protein